VEAEVTLRAATPGDLEAILSLQQAAPGAAAWQPADYASAFADAAGLRLLAEDSVSGRAAGFLVGRLAADEAEILNLAVAPEYRRRGIGRRLVAETLAVARQRGARQCWLEVRAANRTARDFYRALGFAETSRRRGYYRNPEDDAVVCLRPLTAAEPAP
jgi:ribosomal-protein-alanine N-acetyltransferase